MSLGSSSTSSGRPTARNSRNSVSSKRRISANSAEVSSKESAISASDLLLTVHDESNTGGLKLAKDISNLFRLQYGENYHDYILNHPEYILGLIERGEWTAFVIRDKAGALRAHAGLLVSDVHALKFARTVVHPEARGLGLSEIVTDRRLQYIEELRAKERVSTLYTEAVTSHPLTQKTFEKKGFFPSGIFFSKFSDYFNTGKRESAVLMTRVVDLEVSGPKSVYLPDSYKEIAISIYEQLGCLRSIRNQAIAGHTSSIAGDSRKTFTDISDLKGMGILKVTAGAGVSAATLKNLTDKEISKGASYISLRLDLCSPKALSQIEKLRQAGFIFGGIEPEVDHDWLVMQKCADITRKSAEELRLHAENSKELLRKIIEVEFSS